MAPRVPSSCKLSRRSWRIRCTSSCESRMTQVKNSSEGVGPHLALIAVQILFGTWPIFGKVVLRSMSASSLVSLRLTGAALAFALLQRKLTPLLKMPVRDFLLLVLCSMLGVVGNQFLYVK